MSTIHHSYVWLEPVTPLEYIDLYMDLCEYSCEDFVQLELPIEEIVAKRELNAGIEAQWFSYQHQSLSVSSYPPLFFNRVPSQVLLPVPQVPQIHLSENCSLPYTFIDERKSVQHSNSCRQSSDLKIASGHTDRLCSDDPRSIELGLDLSKRRLHDCLEHLPVMCQEIEGASSTSEADDLSLPDSTSSCDAASSITAQTFKDEVE